MLPDWFVEALNKLATKTYANTGRKGILRVVVERELGLVFGIVPGGTAKLHTAAGYVEITADRGMPFDLSDAVPIENYDDVPTLRITSVPRDPA